MGLDRFGYPATHVANSILVEFDDFGDNTEQLEECWYEWLNYNPFDTAVALKLAELLKMRLDTLDPIADRERMTLLQRKITVVENRIDRYHILQKKDT